MLIKEEDINDQFVRVGSVYLFTLSPASPLPHPLHSAPHPPPAPSCIPCVYYTVRCDELKLTLGNLFLCNLIGIFS
jgi:hypothetical protein